MPQGRAKNLKTPESNVGVSLLAIAVFQSTLMSLEDRYREQAHSYRGSA